MNENTIQTSTLAPREALFEDLYRRYHRAIYHFFIRKGCNHEEGQEFVQETFIRAYKGMSNYRGDAEWSWLFAIARRIFLNQIRYENAEKREIQLISLDHMEFEPKPASWPHCPQPALPREPLDEILEKASMEQLYCALAELPPRDRHHWMLRLEGYKYDEIATLMGVSLDSVKSRLRRSRKLLRDKLIFTLPYTRN